MSIEVMAEDTQILAFLDRVKPTIGDSQITARM